MRMWMHWTFSIECRCTMPLSRKRSSLTPLPQIPWRQWQVFVPLKEFRCASCKPGRTAMAFFVFWQSRNLFDQHSNIVKSVALWQVKYIHICIINRVCVSVEIRQSRRQAVSTCLSKYHRAHRFTVQYCSGGCPWWVWGNSATVCSSKGCNHLLIVPIEAWCKSKDPRQRREWYPGHCFGWWARPVRQDCALSKLSACA